MIQATTLTKRFGKTTALDSLTATVPEGVVYGLIGSNGAGKSTLLRLIAGIYRAEAGELTIGGEPVWENPRIKAQIALIPDELYFLPQANLSTMARLYRNSFPGFDQARLNELIELFGLNPYANLNTFSKGMRRQAAIILALSRRPRWLLMDEVFDGLDPIMRNLVRKLIYTDVIDRRATAVISSHSLRELEDTCDQLALLHQGGIIFESEMADLNTQLFKLQVAFGADSPPSLDAALFAPAQLNLVNFSSLGRVANLIVRGDREAAVAALDVLTPSPALVEVLPLTLEEVFLFEMEAIGYHFGEVLDK
ncbi:MAG: ABC transporter ATP-binding protein [Actinomycetes bacterium]|jgi:ABC-2 type transport system ATP-binding protein|nr:ABC transporter ATP-binding protein [Actinomycetes bacterium]